MTQEDKELLLKDLSARLSYGVMCQVDDGAAGLNDGKLIEIDISKELVRFDADINCYRVAYIDDVKPYLRSMSSMTEEEKREYYKMLVESQDCSFENSESATTMVNDWLLSKGFDVRGLISKGLAIAVTEENNPYKE